MGRVRFVWAVVAAFALQYGCNDLGTDPPPSPPTIPAPVIASILPDSAAVGDTIRVVGTNFGPVRGTSVLTIGGQAATVVPNWSDTLISAKIPGSASSSGVTVTVGTKTSAVFPYRIIGTIVIPAPAISGLSSDSVTTGDTVRISGTNFGSTQGSSSVTIGSQAPASIVNWSATEVRIVLPYYALGDSVKITVAGKTSNGARLNARVFRFAADLAPIFLSNGCTSCHGGTNNLFVDSYTNLMAGTSLHGPVVTAGSGESSKIVLKLRGTAGFGVRMPQGGSALPDQLINKISVWITQGALNN